ncbi:MAG: DUF1642 domain-containing protein [Streptococcus salivarius]|jgi:hypothetical protein|nr:MAG TPA: Protein of unknown function (DUF1642) [Caudoviricetes sp.]
MNIQELIERMKGFKKNFGNKVEYIELDTAIELISRLDEPQKVTVPQFVADWIKYCKNTGVTLVRALMVEEIDLYNYANQKDSEKLKAFLRVKENQEIFARAWLDGYTVEKEKRYTVKIKAILGQYLERYYLNNEELTPQFKRTQPTGRDELPTFTRKELEEAGFGEVFNSPLFEVEEVEG